MTRVYWDTMIFIYFLEAHPEFGPAASQMRSRQQSKGDTLCTSVMTLGEILVFPVRNNNAAQCDSVKAHFRPPEVELLPVTPTVAMRFAEIRAKHKFVRPLDAIHLATAAESQVDLFVTNDDQLRKLTIPGIRFFCGPDGKIAY